MNRKEQLLLQEAVNGATVRLSVRTRTRIDAGRWWRRVPVWLCLTEEEIIILAIGRRQHLERITIADCPDAHYNHASGELVIEPTGELRFKQLKMPPSDALRILEFLNTDNRQLTHA